MFQGEVSDLRKKLEDKLPEKVADVVAQMLDPNCVCRDKLSRVVRESFEWRITSLHQAEARLFNLVEGQYAAIVQKLLRDLRIFSGSNAVAFLCLLLATFKSGRTNAQLSVPTGLLLTATLISVYSYLFAQNWFFTILFDDYVGYGYAVYLAIVFVLLWDIILNRARITTSVADLILNAFGGALSTC